LRQEDRQHGVGVVHVADQVALDHALVVSQRHVLVSADHADPDAAEPQIDPAQRIAHFAGQAGDGAGIGGVEHFDLCRAPGVQARTGDFLEPGLAARDEHQPRALFGERDRGGGADAARCAGNHHAQACAVGWVVGGLAHVAVRSVGAWRGPVSS